MPDFQKINPQGSYTLSEAAALKGVSYQSALYAVHSGHLRAERVGGRFVISGTALKGWRPGRRPRRQPIWPGREP
ncbi:MAG TPA: excisionase family DNA-binding protein [Thermomicrobiales bacterium]